MKFSHRTDEEDVEYTPVRNIEMEIDKDATLPHALEAFGQFLKACGYSFDGDLVIEEPVKNRDEND